MADSIPAAPRPVFDPVDTSFDPTAVSARDDVESPSLSSGNALARFEFEPGRSKDGTKVLMVEWEEDAKTTTETGGWEISWEGKKTVLPAKDNDDTTDTETAEGEQQQPVNRLYFLLGPGVPIPTTVRLSKGTVAWKTNPLPAIFPPELGATARSAGKRGVLHTIWAKKRLQVLQGEIQRESGANAEGVGLEMARAEKDWIAANFGVAPRPSSSSASAGTAPISPPTSPLSPSSPRSPGGSRLMDKLKGLRLDTAPSPLTETPPSNPLNEPVPSLLPSTTLSAHPPALSTNPLSPEGSDVAIGSFASFAQLKGPAPPSSQSQQPTAPRRLAPLHPPASTNPDPQPPGGMASLNAFAAAAPHAPAGSFAGGVAPAADEEEDQLFALPMSPRSPEMGRSPFSFAAGDTGRYLKG